MRWPAFLLLAGALFPACGGLALAAIESDIEGFDGPRLTNARMVTKLMPEAGDFLFVGYDPGGVTPDNWWSIGTVRCTSIVDRPHHGRGYWGWDQYGPPPHGDPLYGWWPIRSVYGSTGQRVLDDWNRPWWAIDIGNNANYVLPGSGRTFGVIGVWHRDDGANSGGGVTWPPLGGAYSAWMGLRRHGDLSFVDPITGNPFNADVLQFNGVNAVSPSGNDKGFPGYGSQMDQMLYRDIDLSGAPYGQGMTIEFKLRTDMSGAFQTAPAVRTGWFENDPLAVVAAPPNFTSNSADDATDTGAPRDRFTVYIGAPVEGSYVASDGGTYDVRDPQRRWLSEVIRVNEGLYGVIYTAAGFTPPGNVRTHVDPAYLDQLIPFGRARLVFRVKTNRGFDDEGLAFSSGGAGAVVLDDVTFSVGGSVSPPGWGDFEAPSSIDNDPFVDPLVAWKSTGRPPDAYAHVHGLASLPYEPRCVFCYPENDINVISFGDHEQGEIIGGPPGTAEQERADCIVSPTILLATPHDGQNAIGLTRADLENAKEIYADYCIYTGALDLGAQGCGWRVGVQSYPANDKNGLPDWGQMRFPDHLQFDTQPEDLRVLDPLLAQGLIRTSNPSGIPDSIRICLQMIRQGFRFGAPWPSDRGAYVDDVSLTLRLDGAPEPLSAELWDWFQDTFPFNETPGLPGMAAFDTTTALIRTGLNVAEATGDLTRCDIPAQDGRMTAAGGGLRVDLMFRILPGPGNYVTVGQPASGLRRVPTSATPAFPGDGSFWGTYLAHNGLFGTPGGHLGGAWNPGVWNSARCDTFEANVFAFQSRGVPGGPADVGRWRTTYHEGDPNFALLGTPRGRCFVASDSANVTDLTCGAVPAYVGVPGVPTPPCPAVPLCGTGFDGNVVTLEGTPIIPDGILTPGAHVQYYYRLSRASDPLIEIARMPDPDRVLPQYAEGSADEHRWQEFSVLPDRWKNPAYRHPVTGDYGSGAAAMLVVDMCDRRGNEPVWVGEAAVIGATRQAVQGAHNGWIWHPEHWRDPNDPLYFVSDGWHGGQPGTTWDLYQVKAAESLTIPAGTIGSRLANVVWPDCDEGRSRQGPTPDMLNAYYGLILLLSGDVTEGVVGPFPDRSQDDATLLVNWLQSGVPHEPDRGLWAMGDGFLESNEIATWMWGAPPNALYSACLGALLQHNCYRDLSGNTDSLYTLVTDPVITGTPVTIGLENPCYASAEVLDPDPGAPGSTAASWHQPTGCCAPYIAGVLRTWAPDHPWIALTDGFNIEDLTSYPSPCTPYDDVGRSKYLYEVFNNTFGMMVQITGMPMFSLDCVTDVPPGPDRVAVDFARVVANPVKGPAALRLGLSAPDRVVAGVYDLAGRRVRALADTRFEAGEHTLVWDGRDDAGRPARPGVYLTRVRYEARGFSEVMKLTVLR